MRAALAQYESERGSDDGGGGDAAVVVVDTAPDTAEIHAAGDETVAAITAQADAQVKVIHAETAQQVAVIEAQAKADDAPGDDDTDDGDLFAPEAQHPYFRNWGSRRKARR